MARTFFCEYMGFNIEVDTDTGEFSAVLDPSQHVSRENIRKSASLEGLKTTLKKVAVTTERPAIKLMKVSDETYYNRRAVREIEAVAVEGRTNSYSNKMEFSVRTKDGDLYSEDIYYFVEGFEGPYVELLKEQSAALTDFRQAQEKVRKEYIAAHAKAVDMPTLRQELKALAKEAKEAATA